MKVFGEIRESLRLLQGSLRQLVAFELLFHLLSGFIVLPLAMALLRETLSLSEVSYLSNDTFLKWLTCPLTLPIILVVALVAAFLTIMDMAAVIRCYDETWRGGRMTCWEMLCYGARDALRVFLPWNWMLMVFVLLVIPATNALEVSGVLRNLYLPEFISDYIDAHFWLSLLMAAGMTALFVLAVRWAFSMHFFVLEGRRGGEAAERSRQMMRHRTIHVLWGRMLLGLMLLVTVVALSVALCAGIVVVTKALLPPSAGYSVSLHAIYWVPAVLYGMINFFGVPLVFCYLGALFRRWEPDLAPERPPLSWPRPRHGRRILRTAGVLCMIVAVLFNVASLLFDGTQGYDLLRSAQYTPDITAHRGSSLTAPENSIPAFQGAIYDQADWIELDVHQTRDGVIVVTHDADLSRILGENIKVWKVSFRELEQYDSGAWFSEEYRGLRVATLEEVLRMCKGKVRLNIELKPTGHEENFVKNVVNLVRRYGWSSDCILASMDARTLREIKELEPNIRTLYNMVLAEGDITWIPFADMFSVEASYVNQNLVDRVHAAGKKIFVWTVNDPETIRSLAALQVDNIITDDPWMARQALSNDRLSKSAGWLLRTLAYPDQGEETRSISLDEVMGFLLRKKSSGVDLLAYSALGQSSAIYGSLYNDLARIFSGSPPGDTRLGVHPTAPGSLLKNSSAQERIKVA